MIYLIRHAESLANQFNIWGSNMDLSPNGKEQAKKLIIPKVDICYVSELKRSIQTAKIASDYELQSDKVFNEIYFGDVDNQKITQEDSEFATDDLRKFLKEHRGDDLDERICAFKSKLYTLRGDVAIVTHETMIKALLAEMKGIGVEKAYHIPNIANCEIIAFDNE